MSRLDTLLSAIINLPAADIGGLVEAVRRGPTGLETLKAGTGSAAIRDLCDRLSQELDPAAADYLAGWITGAAATAVVLRADQQIDVVWTGPESAVDTGRFTSRVVIDLIGQAERQLLLASYATRPNVRTLETLVEAARRGVDITILQERPRDNPAFRSGPDWLAHIPARRLIWPFDHRPQGASLHPKFVVVDERIALVGSANLTGRALDVNMECGVLIRGGPHPKAITEHIWSLLRNGALVTLSR